MSTASSAFPRHRIGVQGPIEWHKAKIGCRRGVSLVPPYHAAGARTARAATDSADPQGSGAYPQIQSIAERSRGGTGPYRPRARPRARAEADRDLGRDCAGTSDARSRGIDAQRMTPTSAAAVHERFRAIVARTIARIEREEMAHLVALAAPPPKRRRCAPKRHLNLRKG